jgi:F-type H+-transporting ATPase subunit b
MAEQTIATTHVATGAAGEHEPSALGLDAGGWVALAMLVVFAVAIYLRTPALIASILDKKIAGIRDQLDTAAKLRAEAEGLKADYEAKAREAATEAAEIHAHAVEEANRIIAQAKDDAQALMERRARMAEDKIGAAERTAVAEVRAAAADAATRAAAALIEKHHDESADRRLVEQVIGTLDKRGG